MTPQQVSVEHVDFGAMISNSPKVTALAFGHLMFIWAQLQDLVGIVGLSLQGCLVVFHSLTIVWVGKLCGGPPSAVWLNGPKDK